MAGFKVPVVRVNGVERHPGADRLDLAVIGGYRSVVAKGSLAVGDLVAYVPEGAILPAGLIARLGLDGKLAGPDGNRVHAVRLRGVLSQGLCVTGPWEKPMDDVAAELGIVKYEPEVPDCMTGDVVSVFGHTVKFDIEDSKRFPRSLSDGEEVVAVEKIHGTQCVIGYCPDMSGDPSIDVDVLPYGMVVASKGLAAKGLSFADTEGNRCGNLYVMTALSSGFLPVIREWAADRHPGRPVFVVAEIYGRGVQDLHYGAAVPTLAGIKIVIGGDGDPVFLDHGGCVAAFAEMGMDMAPVVYSGPYDESLLRSLAEGRETVSGRGLHVREGVVVTPARERRDDSGPGRVSLKFVGEGYLTRSGGTEWS